MKKNVSGIDGFELKIVRKYFSSKIMHASQTHQLIIIKRTWYFILLSKKFVY